MCGAGDQNSAPRPQVSVQEPLEIHKNEIELDGENMRNQHKFGYLYVILYCWRVSVAVLRRYFWLPRTSRKSVNFEAIVTGRAHYLQ